MQLFDSFKLIGYIFEPFYVYRIIEWKVQSSYIPPHDPPTISPIINVLNVYVM